MWWLNLSLGADCATWTPWNTLPRFLWGCVILSAGEEVQLPLGRRVLGLSGPTRHLRQWAQRGPLLAVTDLHPTVTLSESGGRDLIISKQKHRIFFFLARKRSEIFKIQSRKNNSYSFPSESTECSPAKTKSLLVPVESRSCSCRLKKKKGASQ